MSWFTRLMNWLAATEMLDSDWQAQVGQRSQRLATMMREG